MRIKEWEYSNFAKDIKDVCSLLIYGPDRGLVKDNSDFFLEEQKKSLQNSLEIFKLTPEDFAKSESLLFELAYQKPIFYKKTFLDPKKRAFTSGIGRFEGPKSDQN